MLEMPSMLKTLLLTVIDRHVRQVEWWKKKLGISDYGAAWIAFAKGLVLGYALCFFI